MPLDQVLVDTLLTLTLSQGGAGSAMTSVLDRNLVQGVGVVNTTLVMQHGSTADDAATNAALRTAIHVPQHA